MQNKLHTTQFFSPLDDQFAANPWAVIAEPGNPEFCEIPEKVWTAGQETIWTHGNEKSRFLPPSQPPFLNWAWRLRYGMFPLASLGYLSGYAPSQPLPVCSSSEYKKFEKVLDFIATTEKNQCYQHSSRTKSKAQQQLRGKLTLPQPKPGQSPFSREHSALSRDEPPYSVCLV